MFMRTLCTTDCGSIAPSVPLFTIAAKLRFLVTAASFAKEVVAVDVFKIVVGFCQRLFEFRLSQLLRQDRCFLTFVADIAADVDVLSR